eukprot:2340382-Rhodomonas_salina.1
MTANPPRLPNVLVGSPATLALLLQNATIVIHGGAPLVGLGAVSRDAARRIRTAPEPVGGPAVLDEHKTGAHAQDGLVGHGVKERARPQAIQHAATWLACLGP